MHRETVQIGDARLSIAISGEGRPFVFQHGLCGAAEQTVSVFPDELDWQLTTMECRGHGESECGEFEQLSIEQFTSDLAAFIAILDVGPVVVGGISMGAAIALRLAVKQPELVCGLVLARPAWVGTVSPKNLAPSREVARFLRDYEPTEAKKRFERSHTASQLKREAPDNLASLLGFFDRIPQNETQALLAGIASGGPGVSIDQIKSLNIRTLVIGTAQDFIHPLEMAHELADLIPNAQFVEITSKTSNPKQYQAEFQSALRHFLQEME